MFGKSKKNKNHKPQNQDHDGTFEDIQEQDFFGVIKIVAGVTNASDPHAHHDVGIDISYTSELAKDFTDEQIERLVDVLYVSGIRETLGKIVHEIVTIGAENIKKNSK